MNGLFAFFSSLALICATMVVRCRNEVHSVLFLILAFVSASALLILVDLDFFAMVYLVVYVGAIAVLFLFVVMMLNLRRQVNESVLPYFPIGVLIGLIFLFQVFSVLSQQFLPFLLTPELLTPAPEFDGGLAGGDTAQGVSAEHPGKVALNGNLLPRISLPLISPEHAQVDFYLTALAGASIVQDLFLLIKQGVSLPSLSELKQALSLDLASGTAGWGQAPPPPNSGRELLAGTPGDAEVYLSWSEKMRPISAIEALAQVLYTWHFAYFLLASLILLIAMVGGITLTMHKGREVQKQEIAEQNRRDPSRTAVKLRDA